MASCPTDQASKRSLSLQPLIVMAQLKGREKREEGNMREREQKE
jgi:hypothetical protein